MLIEVLDLLNKIGFRIIGRSIVIFLVMFAISPTKDIP